MIAHPQWIKLRRPLGGGSFADVAVRVEAIDMCQVFHEGSLIFVGGTWFEVAETPAQIDELAGRSLRWKLLPT